MQTTEIPTTPTLSKQHLANLANALHSTGPRTEAGKAKSSMNARRHGLTGQFYVMDDADRLAYAQFEHGIFTALAPVGPYEHQCAIAIAQDHWRLNRSRAIEYNTLGLGHNDFAGQTDTNSAQVEAAVAQAQTWGRDHSALTNTSLYESRINRAIARHEKRLDELQRTRKTAEALAIQQAEDLLRLRLAKGVQINPKTETIQVNGFDFAASQLLAQMHRKDELEEAAYYKSHSWKPAKPWHGPAQTLPKAA